MNLTRVLGGSFTECGSIPFCVVMTSRLSGVGVDRRVFRTGGVLSVRRGI